MTPDMSEKSVLCKDRRMNRQGCASETDARMHEDTNEFPHHSNVRRTLFAIALACMTGCSPNQKENTPAPTAPSLFGELQVPFRAVVVTRGQTPYPLESLDVNASPASEIAPLFKAAIIAHEQEVVAVTMEINQTETQLQETEARLETAQGVVASGYDERLPDVSKAPDRDDPEYLDWASEISRKKSVAGQWYEQQLSVTIRPIEGEIASIESRLRQLHSQLNFLRSNYNNVIFNALPDGGSRHWVTDVNGHAAIAIPQTEPWIIWARSSRLVAGVTTEHYRWILKTPDELDSNGKLFADHRNLLDVRGLVLDKETGLVGAHGDAFEPD